MKNKPDKEKMVETISDVLQRFLGCDHDFTKKEFENFNLVKDLGADELDLLEISIRLEEEFSIIFDEQFDEDIKQFSVKDLIDACFSMERV